MPVSLFYHYTDLPNEEDFARDISTFGFTHDLAGRIRVSGEGINGTFGGTEEQVQAFHNFLLQRLNYPTIDFKVSAGSASNFPRGWNVRVCNELVTMGIAPELASWKEAAPHLNAEQFRDEALRKVEKPTGDVIMLDVRNQYESAIGRFKGAVLPPIRQFSDLAKFLLANSDMFFGKRVLMYCTGGIRCERASAFLGQMHVASSVAQLQGGIDRFLNRFPKGGDVFEGKNLVFDTRMVQPQSSAVIVGRCISCRSEWDDYSNGARCVRCRSRVLLCGREQCCNDFIDKMAGLCASCHNR